jgi:hypothetical protein
MDADVDPRIRLDQARPHDFCKGVDVTLDTSHPIAPAPARTSRVLVLRHHPEQQRLVRERKRLKIVHAGRRSGKTAIAKRVGTCRAMNERTLPDAWIVFAAPTQEQARRIFWEDIKRLVPDEFVERVWDSSSTMMLRLVNGAEISVLGIDKPERLEGRPLDWVCVDEFANTRPMTWERHLSQALLTPGRPLGEAWLIGVPEGQNHMFRLYREALSDIAKFGDRSEWGVYRWDSSDILDADAAAFALRMDPRTYEQEMRGGFVAQTGRAYYAFDRMTHASRRLNYEQGRPLIFTLDFNTAPGVAAVGQERLWPLDDARPSWRHEHDVGPRPPNLAEQFDAWIGQVWIREGSNSLLVARRLVTDWNPDDGQRARHRGKVIVDGDATGGIGGSAKVEGSDWDLVRKVFSKVHGWDVEYRHGSTNPREGVRVRAMNSALMDAEGMVRTQIDPEFAHQIVDDLDATMTVEGGSGELLKDPKRYPERTHMSDAVGYHAARAHPIRSVISSVYRA